MEELPKKEPQEKAEYPLLGRGWPAMTKEKEEKVKEWCRVNDCCLTVVRDLVAGISPEEVKGCRGRCSVTGEDRHTVRDQDAINRLAEILKEP